MLYFTECFARSGYFGRFIFHRICLLIFFSNFLLFCFWGDKLFDCVCFFPCWLLARFLGLFRQSYGRMFSFCSSLSRPHKLSARCVYVSLCFCGGGVHKWRNRSKGVHRSDVAIFKNSQTFGTFKPVTQSERTLFSPGKLDEFRCL